MKQAESDARASRRFGIRVCALTRAYLKGYVIRGAMLIAV